MKGHSYCEREQAYPPIPKSTTIDVLNAAMDRELRAYSKVTGVPADTNAPMFPLPSDAKWTVHPPQVIATEALMLRYETGQGDDFNTYLSAEERVACSAEWSRQLRAKVAASAERERIKVVVDLDWT